MTCPKQVTRARRRNLNPTTIAECEPGQVVWVQAVVTNVEIALIRIGEAGPFAVSGDVEVRLAS